MSARRFPFAIEPRYRPLLRLWGVRPESAWVEVDDARLEVRFGRFALSTPLDNVTCAHVDGPYRPRRVIGPRLSLSDKGVTFGTTARAGVCICLEQPEPALLGRWLAHPNVSVTVSDVEGLAALLDPDGAAASQ